jgi:hypothetical protein
MSEDGQGRADWIFEKAKERLEVGRDVARAASRLDSVEAKDFIHAR